MGSSEQAGFYTVDKYAKLHNQSPDGSSGGASPEVLTRMFSRGPVARGLSGGRVTAQPVTNHSKYVKIFTSSFPLL